MHFFICLAYLFQAIDPTTPPPPTLCNSNLSKSIWLKCWLQFLGVVNFVEILVYCDGMNEHPESKRSEENIAFSNF